MLVPIKKNSNNTNHDGLSDSFMEERYRVGLRNLIRKIRRYNSNFDVGLLRKAYEFSYAAHKDQLRRSGEAYFEHPFKVGIILADLRMDLLTICGGLLHDVAEDTGFSLDEVREEFGNEMATLVNGVTKISELKFDSIEVRQAENFRKMIVSMVEDIRVILIKFADRLHNMRTLEFLPEKKQVRIARETLEVYAPLAHRLGIGRIKWELEDLAFKILYPVEYKQIVKKVADRRDERERYIQRISRPIRNELKKSKLESKIIGRPKHFYSIFNKMRTRQLPFEEIYDLLAIRIIVKRIEDCYHALGIVHSLFTPIHEKFNDYIATPKSNMYQSLHTKLIGPEGKTV
ncbi:MAG: HD domain-containing protein, partial [bacterium]|nr:HD domain-containing protein [bacterium]